MKILQHTFLIISLFMVVKSDARDALTKVIQDVGREQNCSPNNIFQLLQVVKKIDEGHPPLSSSGQRELEDALQNFSPEVCQAFVKRSEGVCERLITHPEDECPICWDPYNEREVRYLECSHHLCGECLPKLEKSQCPTCQAPLSVLRNPEKQQNKIKFFIDQCKNLSSVKISKIARQRLMLRLAGVAAFGVVMFMIWRSYKESLKEKVDAQQNLRKKPVVQNF